MKSSTEKSSIRPPQGFLMKALVTLLVTATPLLALSVDSSAQVSPESVGMSSERLESMATFVNRHIEAGHITGDP
jgi:hypothetical protein